MAPNHTDYYGTAVHTLAYPVMTSTLDDTDIGTEVDFYGEENRRTRGERFTRGLYFRHND